MIIKNIIKILPSKLFSNFKLLAIIIVLLGLLETLSLSLILPIINFIFGSEESFPIDIKIVKDFFLDLDFSKLILIFLIVFIIKNLFIASYNWYLQKFLAKLKENLSFRFYNNYFNQSYSHFKNLNSSQLIRNIILEVNNFSGIFQNLLNLFSEFLVIILILFFLFSYDFVITSSAILLFIITGLGYYFFLRNYLKKLGTESVKFSKIVIKDIQESYNNFRSIKMLDQTSLFAKDFINKNLKSINALRILSFFQSLTRVWLETLLILVFVVLIYIFQSNESFFNLNLAKISFFFIASIKIIPSINKIINFLQKLKYSNATIEIILSELNKFENLSNVNETNKNLNYNFSKNLNIKNLVFSYEDKKILDDFNLEIKNSELVLITGRSGVGKSTLIELICGLILPNHGGIYIGSENILDDLKNWRKKIGYVPQNVFLIQDTISKNISFSQKNLENSFENKNKILDLINLVKLDEFIENLTDKEKTILNEQSVNISGGQAQRIGIARMLYQDPEILIFDESFNSLNKDLGFEILKKIKKKFHDKKIIVVSHDQYFQSLADKIIELK